MQDITPPRLEALINRFEPTTILAVGPASEALLAPYLADHPDTRLDTLNADALARALDGLGRYDLGIVSHAFEYMDKTRAEELISKLRDLHTQRLIVALPLGREGPAYRSVWSRTDLLGLGLVEVAAYERDGECVGIFAFDIATYKTTPEWLNSSYWAHPELFDKYWW